MPIKIFNSIRISSFVLSLLCLLTTTGNSTNAHLPNYSETGQPFIKYFNANSYNATAVNWKIVQDHRGVMYFGNGIGVLEFDGLNWRLIAVPRSENVRALAVDANGIIYVCASKDFGYLTPDTHGLLKYRSLKHHLPEKDWDFGEIWDVAANAGKVYFKTRDKIFMWDGKNVSIIDSVSSYRFYKIGNTLYTRNNGTGLMIVEGDSLRLMPDGAYFKSTGVFNMLPFGNHEDPSTGEILVTTNRDGLFLLKNEKFIPFRTNVDSLLIDSQIYNAIMMKDGNIALATQRGGVFILDASGKLIRRLNKKLGLPTNVVFDIFQDRSEGLWLATLYGIVYCEVPSPFSLFLNSGLLNTMSNSVMRFHDTIYITNEYGILYISDQNAVCHLVEGSNKPAYALFNVKGELWSGTNHGVVKIRNKKISGHITEAMSSSVVTSKKYSDRVLIGTSDGLEILQLGQKNQITHLYQAETVDEVTKVMEDRDGSIWLSGYFYGLYHVTGDMENLGKPNVQPLNFTFYDHKNGLPGGTWDVYEINNALLFATDSGIYRFSSETKKFIPDSTLGPILSKTGNQIHLIEKGLQGNLWILATVNGTKMMGKAIHQSNGMYAWKPIPELNRLDLATTYAVYVDIENKGNREILWISSNEALVRYDPDFQWKHGNQFSTLIRQVRVKGDSVIYGGYGIHNAAGKPLVLPNKLKNVSFSFSSTAFHKMGASQFRYFLEGNDDSWSHWTSDYKKEYTNLSGGDYIFQVQAKNIYGEMGKTDSYYFSVQPPWYFSWWAYLVYGSLLIMGVFSVDRFQRSRLIARERKTAKLREAELIKKQAEELATIDNIVREINKELDLNTLLTVLLEQGMRLFPQATTGIVLMYNDRTDEFKIEAMLGLKNEKNGKKNLPADLIQSLFLNSSDAVDNGVFIVRDPERINNCELFKILPVPHSLLLMTAVWNDKMEGIIIFTNLSPTDVFDATDIRKLVSFREHTISAIAKARILKELQDKNKKLVKTQQQLVTQEKLASLGQLTAGIAHEIKNPLNFVTNFSETSTEMIQELNEELSAIIDQMGPEKSAEIEELLNMLTKNINRINEHGKRADKIVRSMLEHSRGTTGDRRETDMNALLEENVNLVYHGMRALDSSTNFTIIKKLDPQIGNPVVIPQNISRVFLNILQNAAYAAKQYWEQHPGNSARKYPDSLNDDSSIDQVNKGPAIWVITKQNHSSIQIRIGDNGPGISKEMAEKIFLPFFTTKPSGEGTGLGLSITHDIIVEEHGGQIEVESEPGHYTEFIIHLPKSPQQTHVKES